MRAPTRTDPARTGAVLTGRVLEPADFVADTAAFVDVRIERSRGKVSYSFVGPGVSQNADQHVSISEPHGFNVGAATMPHGVYNNAHLHYTPEVFVCTRGNWRVDIGRRREQAVHLTPGAVLSVPPWVFRGFENTGCDDGFLFVVLGGDDTGGILWAPEVLREAAETGLYLRRDNTLIEAGNGAVPQDRIQPLSDSQLACVDAYSDAELAQRVVTGDQRRWSAHGLLSSVLGPQHAVELAPVIGFGLCQDRLSRPPIRTPHGFGLEWLRASPGTSTGLHRHDDSQVVLLLDGDWEVALNEPDQQGSERPAAGSLVSIPASAWRDLRNVGATAAHAVVITGGDGPSRVEWSGAVLAEATAAGFGLDAAGYVAPLELLGSGL
ncbi:cupin domain-containing protein [Candidatus Poriferisodalis sp.]|uniref:cupin domain-containing protein n=1 Tax=Candidatus Poriferisodalis sp. TaxID=3101277 RepID=UPI003B014C27